MVRCTLRWGYHPRDAQSAELNLTALVIGRPFCVILQTVLISSVCEQAYEVGEAFDFILFQERENLLIHLVLVDDKVFQELDSRRHEHSKRTATDLSQTCPTGKAKATVGRV